MEKPARLQVDPDSLPDDKPPQTGNVFNVWYLKWSGGDGTQRFEKLKFRVDIKKDSGYTKANKSKAKTATICLYFSKGCCYKGSSCEYLHRLPTEDDYYPPTQDCFGRDKTFGHRDDMNGVGSLNKINDTLYIGGLHVGNNTETVLTQNFSEFGKISKIKVLHSKACAFLTYRHEFEAQFAKEAMDNQSLNNNEVLIVRWANDDPDPNSQAANKRKLEEITVNTVRNLLKRQAESEETIENSAEPEIELAEDYDEEENEKPTQKLLSDSMFNKSSLLALRKLKKPKVLTPADHQTVPTETNLGNMLGYSSDDD